MLKHLSRNTGIRCGLIMSSLLLLPLALPLQAQPPAAPAAPLFGPPAPIPGGLGTITYINHELEEISINDRDYTFRSDELRVTYLESRTGRLVYLQEGMVVRFDLDQDGHVVHVNLVGPPKRLNDIINR